MCAHPTINILVQSVITTALKDYFMFTGKNCSSKYRILNEILNNFPEYHGLELLKLCHKWRFNNSEITEEEINRMYILYEKWKAFRNKLNWGVSIELSGFTCYFPLPETIIFINSLAAGDSSVLFNIAIQAFLGGIFSKSSSSYSLPCSRSSLIKFFITQAIPKLFLAKWDNKSKFPSSNAGSKTTELSLK